MLLKGCVGQFELVMWVGRHDSAVNTRSLSKSAFGDGYFNYQHLDHAVRIGLVVMSAVCSVD